MNGWCAILAFALGFIIAQTCKFVIGLFQGKKRPAMDRFRNAIDYLTRSGGMPSGHSASMMAFTTCAGLMYGFESGIFALAVAVTLIILYDATHVRYAVGIQGVALNRILEKNGQKTLPVFEGHTIWQVVVGSLLGVLIGWGVYFLVV